MLTGLNVAFIGGDARQLEVIHQFCELDANVILVGFDSLEQQFRGAQKADLSELLMSKVDALILPAVVSDHSGKIETLFSSGQIELEDRHLQALPKQTKVYTGFAKPFLKERCKKQGVELVEIFDRDDVAIYNSIPTAEGAIMMAIENTDFTIHGSHSIVLGLGRTGMTLARTLQGMGANVKMGVRKNEHLARAYEMGLTPFHVRDLRQEVAKTDLLFNTIPAPIVTAKIMSNMPHRTVIIDLASKPGGTDFRYAEKRAIKALLAPGLPGIVAPKTAGRIMATCLIQLITENTGIRGEK